MFVTTFPTAVVRRTPLFYGLRLRCVPQLVEPPPSFSARKAFSGPVLSVSPALGIGRPSNCLPRNFTLQHNTPHCFRYPYSSCHIVAPHRTLTMSTPSDTRPAGDDALPKSVADLRVAYSDQPLDDNAAGHCPFLLFRRWMEEAIAAHEHEPNAMCLSTVGPDHRPAARMVLLKGYDHRAFVWYTNYDSRKAHHLAQNAYAALTFWWPTLQRSVRVEGTAQKVSESESDAYFHSRPPESQLGALVSDQSRDLASRDHIEQRWRQLCQTYLDSDGRSVTQIPRPSHWGGYRLVPDRIEFWKGRAARLHDRIVFDRDDAGELLSNDNAKWKRRRLQP